MARFSFLAELRSLGISPRRIARLAGLTALFALFEGVGVGLLLPVLRYAERAAPPADDGLGRALALVGVDPSRVGLPVLLALSFAPLLLRAILQYQRDVDATRAKLDLAARLRARAARAFLRADRAFWTARDRSQMLAALGLESDRAAEALATRVVFATGLLLAIAYVALLFAIAPLLALLTLPALGAIAAGFRRQRFGAARLGASVSGGVEELGRRASDALHGIERVKLRGQEDATASEIARAAGRIADGLFGIERLRLRVEMGMMPLAALVALGVVYLAVVPLGLSLASLGLFVFVLVRLVPQVTQMNGMWAQMHGCGASLTRLLALVREAEECQEPTGGTRGLAPGAHAVRFTDVSFRYRGADGRALDGVSFEVPRGTSAAIVGRSGAGKSTLLRLLCGFYPPEAGRVAIDGVPLADLDLHAYRRRLAVVAEDPFLFHGTVRENLLYGNDGADDPAIAEALRLAHASAFAAGIGLDAVVGERAVRLSQGQRQRLAIAHALLSRPEILVLDEPTSALDAEADQAIQDALAALRGRVTVIVIAHRLATIRNADSILVLDAGRLLAQGSHAALLERCEIYRQLWSRQSAA